MLRNLEGWNDTNLIYLDRNCCWRLISTALLIMSASYLNHHLKKRIRLGKIAIQNNFLLCISAGPMLSSVSAALWWKGCVSTAFATSIFLAFSKSTDNNKADSNNNYKGSNQIYGLTLKSCVSDSWLADHHTGFQDHLTPHDVCSVSMNHDLFTGWKVCRDIRPALA